MNFIDIVEKYTKEELTVLYKVFSILTHPHDYGNVKSDKIAYFLTVIQLLITDLYGNLDQSSEGGINEEIKLIFHKENISSRTFYEITQKQLVSLDKICNVFNDNFNRNFISNILGEVKNLYLDLCTDILFGFR